MSDLRARPPLSSSGLATLNDEKMDTDNTLERQGISPHDSSAIDMMNGDKEVLLKKGGESLNGVGKDEDHHPHDTRFDSVRIFGRTFNKIVLMTHFNVFLYAACFWIQNAVFPYLSKQLGADPVTFGYLQTTFAFVQLAGGPLFGRFGDVFGSRLAMMMAFVAASSTYFLLYVAMTIPLLFLSRLPSVFMHAMQGGQMIVTDVCDTKERANALAKLGLSYGLGMVTGTLLGGIIAKLFSLETGALIACVGSLLSIALIYSSIPTKLKKTQTTQDSNDTSVFSLKKMFQLLKSPGAFFLMSVKIGTGIPIGIFQSMFSIIALETFNLPPDQNSYMMTYIGVLSMIVQGLGVGVATKRFSDLAILTGSAALLAVSYFALSLVSSITQMCLVFLPMITGLTFQTVITTSALTNTVSNADTGAMLGLGYAVNSMIRSVSPTIGGYMLRSAGFASFGQLGFVTSSLVTFLLLVKLRRERR